MERKVYILRQPQPGGLWQWFKTSKTVNMTIVPVSIWYNGQVKTAEDFKLRVVGDDLSTQATFYYELLETEEPNPYVVAAGNLYMDPTAYALWKAESDTNTYAYTWAATQLNLTLD